MSPEPRTFHADATRGSCGGPLDDCWNFAHIECVPVVEIIRRGEPLCSPGQAQGPAPTGGVS